MKTNIPSTLLAFLLGLFLANQLTAAVQPNIIYIMADDLGPHQLSSYGNQEPGETTPERTPRIDRLADQGLRFDRAYTTAVCEPTRNQLSSGLRPFRNGSLNNSGGGAAVEQNTGPFPNLRRMMSNAGYVCAAAGKLQGFDNGWDEYVGTPTGSNAYADNGQYCGTYYNLNGVQTPANGVWHPRIENDFLLDFIDRHRSEPFFIYYPIQLPHVPYVPPPGSTTTDEAALHDEYVHWIDKFVGLIHDKLIEHGIEDDSLIIFTADNGTFRHKASIDGREVLGGKRNIDDGCRVPFVLHWPNGGFAPGQTIDWPIEFTDVFVTFMELAGGSVDPSVAVQPEGYSFAPFLQGQSYTPRGWAYAQYSTQWLVTTSDYRLDYDGKFYDLSDMPFSLIEIPPGTETPEQAAVKADLQGILDDLDPANGPSYEWEVDYLAKNAFYTFKNNNWRWNTKGYTPISGDAADPDGDGYFNLFEMAIGSDPNDASDPGWPPEFVVSGETMQLKFPSDTHPSVDFQAEFSIDLEEWGTTGVQESSVDGETTAVVPIDPETDRSFIRLRAERVDP